MSSMRTLLSLQVLLISVFSLCNQKVSASLIFCNDTARLVFDCDQDRIRIGKVASVFGFEQNSIVKKFGFDNPSDWTESYTAGVEIGKGRICPSTYPVENNSNAIFDLDVRLDFIEPIVGFVEMLTVANSNLLLTKCKDIENNSNAIEAHETRIFLNEANITQNTVDIASNVVDIRHNSNALVYCCNNNSNAIISLDDRVTINEADIIQNAVDIAANVVDIRHNSNALLYCCKNNSNSLLYCCKNNSNALLYGIKNNSNALLYCCRVNSNAIVKLRADLSTIDALVPDIDICTATFDLMFDLWISPDNILTVQTKAGPDVCIDGRGHYIHFSRDVSNIFVIESGLCVTTKNVVLKDYSDTVLDLDPSSRLKFGEGTVVELADCETLLRDWEFEGNSILSGFGNELDLDDHAILAVQGSRPIFHDVCFANVKNNNIRSVGNDICITLKDVQLFLTGDYSYTSGALKFKKEVIVTGLYEFSYETDLTSTICTKSTLFIDKNTSFNYSPIDLRDRHIEMQDESARMFWFGCDITIGNTWRLKTGTLCIDHKVPVSLAAGGGPEAFLVFGDGVSNNDLSVAVFPAAVLDIQQTTQLTYENVDI